MGRHLSVICKFSCTQTVMEFRNKDASVVFNPPSFKGSAFSRPILPPCSSLISPAAGGGSGDGAGGGNSNSSAFPSGNSTISSALAAPPPRQPAPAAGNYSPYPSPKNPDPSAVPSSPGHKHCPVTYKECLRNHAASSGGHVVDGCLEFMPNGGPSTPQALKCAACGCHRSFHRMEPDADVTDDDDNAYLPLLLLPPRHHDRRHRFPFGSPLSQPPRRVPGAAARGGATTESSSDHRVNAMAGAPRKRFRTKFTAQQKEKMLAFAQRIGWRLQKQEEPLVQQFCADAGIKRRVLKVWMHNNKHVNRKPPLPTPSAELQHQENGSAAAGEAMLNPLT